MAGYVYIMSTYGEYGLEPPIVATVDRGRIISLFEQAFPHHVKYLTSLKEILEQPDEELCCHIRTENLPDWWSGDKPYWEHGQHEIQEGWSGLQLMVLKLDD